MNPEEQGTVEERWAQYAHLKSQAFNLNKAAVFDALHAARLTLVSVTFDGCGDSGQIESVDAYAGNQIRDLPAVNVDLISVAFNATEHTPGSVVNLRAAIEDLALEALEETHSGWEDNDGAYGEFVFDVTARTITLAFNERYIAADYSEHEF